MFFKMRRVPIAAAALVDLNCPNKKGMVAMRYFLITALKLLVLYLLWQICLYMAAFGAEWSYIAIFTAVIGVGAYIIISLDRVKNELIKLNKHFTEKEIQ